MSRDPNKTPKENIKEDLKNIKDNVKENVKEMKDKVKDNVNDIKSNTNENIKNIKDSIKEGIDAKKPKIQVPPIPKSRISPGFIGLAVLGVAGAYYYYTTLNKPLVVDLNNPPKPPQATTLNPGVPVKVEIKK